MTTSTRAGIVLLVLVALGGCAGPEPDPVPSGPDDTFSGSVGGSLDKTERFTVPDGASRLTVAASYSVGGTGRFELFDPTGVLQQSASVSGGAASSDDSWFQMDDPPAGEWRLRLRLEGGVVYDFQVFWDEAAAVPPVDPAQSESTAPSIGAAGTWVAVAAGAGVGIAGVAFLATEFGRFKALSGLAALGLFTRLEKDEVLAHETREQVYQFIRDNPGPSFSDLLRGLEVSNGTLVHHLRILEAQEFIRPHRDGFRTRFYVRGPKVVPTAYVTRAQQQILDAISARPGVSQKELASVLGIPREAVSYHTRRLAAQGQLQVRQEGKWRRYWRAGTSSDATAAQPA